MMFWVVLEYLVNKALRCRKMPPKRKDVNLTSPVSLRYSKNLSVRHRYSGQLKSVL